MNHIAPKFCAPLALCTLLTGDIVTPVLARESQGSNWDWGVRVGAGYFNFRDSLFVDIDPDPPGNLSDDWLEFYVKPWVSFDHQSGNSEFFGKLSYAYVKTDGDAADVAGGSPDSSDIDDAYLGWRYGQVRTGQFELVGGRYPYHLGNGFLIWDGYADGGSRGGFWSNARGAWAPGGKAAYRYGGHTFELLYLDRDERPESDSETQISAINYEYLSNDEGTTLGLTWLSIEANELAAQRDGADMYNFRLFMQSLPGGLGLDAEWVKQDNGLALDADAWYVQPYYRFDSSWEPVLYYRYAYFEGDNPDTVANEDYDTMFPGFYDWGSWWQGEIAGEYFLSNSNLKTNMLRLHVSPTDDLGTGLIWFDYTLDEPRSYQGGVSSDDLGSEVNWYMDWGFTDYFTISVVLARTEVGSAVTEAFGRTKDFKYGMLYLAFSY